MGKFLFAIFKAARPKQWLKNIALFTTILFSGQLFRFDLLFVTFLGFIAFCFLSSSAYIINDIIDVRRDRKHPFKKFRPIASGAIAVPIALALSFSFLGLGLFFANLVGPSFLYISLVFIALQYTYSLILKHISIVDILTITAAYFLRVYAGEAAIGFHISVWLALAALSLALFLAIGKRRAEKTLLTNYREVSPRDTRNSLSRYSERLLDTYTSMFANSTFITYAYFTFLEKPAASGALFRNFETYTMTFSDRKWMMLTIPFVLYGIMRYMQLIYEGKGESPEQIVTSDIPLLGTIVLWVGAVVLIIYGIGG